MPHPVAPVLARYPSILRPLIPPRPLGNAGGLSGASLWRVRSAQGELALRLWPIDGPGLGDLARIHSWLAQASPLGFVPVPIPGLDGRTLQEFDGRIWELSPWMPGVAATPEPHSTGQVRAAFSCLAAFHQRLAPWRITGLSPGLSARLRELEALLRGGFDEIQAAVRAAPLDRRRDLATRWLDAARRLAPVLESNLRREAGHPVPIQPCLRDARQDHFLFDGDRLTGLVDFGAMGLDPVSCDLSRLLSEWIGPDRSLRAEALDSYAAVRPLYPSETALIDVFHRSTSLLLGGHWARWHFLEGREFDPPSAVLDGLIRGVDRISDLASGSDTLPGMGVFVADGR